MKFGEDEILERQRRLLAPRYRFINRLRLDILCFKLFLVLGVCIFLAACLAGAFQGIFESAPKVSEEQLLTSQETTIFFDKDGNELQRLEGSGISRKYIALENISSAAQNAFIAAEDTGYYKHHGVDIRSVAGIFYGAEGSAENAQGRRSLTQKLIRNQIFVNENNNSVFDRFIQKVQEQYLALRLESDMGKKKILEYYLNTLYFGGNRLGIDSASRYYFDKGVQDLTVSEAAMLAAVAQDPEQYDPMTHQVQNSSKRMEILNAMLNMESITEEEYEDALGDNVYITIQTVKRKENSKTQVQDYYTSAVISQVIADLKKKAGYSTTQAYHAVYQSGVRIYTCLDGEIQALCENEVNRQLEQMSGDKKMQISFVLLDQATGEVKALIGGDSEEIPRMGSNRAVDVAREPGEVLCPLSVWLPGVDTAGMTMGSIFDDCAYAYAEIGRQEGQKKTAGYEGLVTLRNSMIEQLETPAIKALEKIDVRTGYDYLKRLGISTLVEKREDMEGNVTSDLNLSLAKGQMIEGVTNLELTSAYAALAYNGKSVKPTFYKKLVDRDGNVLLENERTERQIIQKSSAWLITNALCENMENGEGQSADFGDSSIEVAGIGGESEAHTDVWFEGYTPFYTAGIWCGYDDYSVVTKEFSYHLLWKRIMKKVHAMKKTTHARFGKPNDVLSCNICTKCGKLAVEELCEEAVGGSAVKREYFVNGTQPTQSCSCHVKYRICEKSNMLATEACPADKVTERVYLVKKEESKTKDSDYVMPKKISKSFCTTHR